MKFKKIEMFGFKSFADKLEIQFDDGITGIVGPNGCGKSNVADSIRWVLGEQSAKSLRGHSMTDVIFAGTQNRKMLSFCEVSLIFDNSDRKIDLDYSEIIVTRKLYRSGDSEYLINREPSRLRDVVDLLREIGVHKDGYCMIGQGKVSEIINSKPEDRRGIFEEACGISKFKQRKVETERKLARTHDNLLRINDILSEVERQVGPLLKQSETAKKYLELKAKLTDLEINFFLHQHETAADSKAKIEQDMVGTDEEIALRESDIARVEQDEATLREAVNGADTKIEALHEQKLAISMGLQGQMGELEKLKSQIELIESSRDRAIADREEYTAEVSSLTEQEQANLALIEALTAETERLSAEYEQAMAEYLEVVDVLTRGEAESDESNRRVMRSLEELTEIKANYSRFVTEKKNLLERQSALKADMERLEQEKSTYGEAADALASSKAQKEAERTDYAEKRDRISELLDKLEVAIASHRKELSALEAEQVTLKERQTVLRRVQDSLDNYQRAVQQLLLDAKRDAALGEKILGTVAQLVTVDKRYETAMDVALGGAMQNVVVRYEQDAKDLIAYLKRREYGRVTFLPVETVRGRTVDEDVRRTAQGVEGYLGVASELITFAPELKQIFQNLLGRTLIAADTDSAARLARALRYTVRIVSLEGDVVHPFGAMTGGSNKKKGGSLLLGGERELAEIEERLKELAERTAVLAPKLTEYEQKRSEGTEKFKLLQSRLYELDLALVEMTERYEKQKTLYDEKERLYAAYAEENFRNAQKIERIETDLADVDAAEEYLQKQKELAAGESDKFRVTFEELRAKRTRLNEQTTELKVALTEKKTAAENARAEGERLSAALLTAKAKALKAEQDLDSCLAVLTELDSRRAMVHVSEEDERKLEEAVAEIARLQSFKSQAQAQMIALGNRRKEAQELLNLALDKKRRQLSAIERVDTDLELLQKRIAEEYELDYEGATAYRNPEFVFEGAEQEITRTRRSINGLGSVNVNAIEEYREMKERYDELSAQKEDLDKAEADMRQIISELTKEMQTRFDTGFAEISQHFQRIFKELFGGGNAKLVLLESENGDPLNQGVDIVAEPPGKKLQNISLLSGGEMSLTAIAILFAILKLKPMPFCVLDEIEAALDDANTDRFARYLKRFSKDTQFIVITHKKPTMEQADVLYGVTMEEKGVSKMVSVQLTDIDFNK